MNDTLKSYYKFLGVATPIIFSWLFGIFLSCIVVFLSFFPIEGDAKKQLWFLITEVWLVVVLIIMMILGSYLFKMMTKGMKSDKQKNLQTNTMTVIGFFIFALFVGFFAEIAMFVLKVVFFVRCNTDDDSCSLLYGTTVIFIVLSGFEVVYYIILLWIAFALRAELRNISNNSGANDQEPLTETNTKAHTWSSLRKNI